MGSILSAKCKCGFDSADVLVGAGRSTFTKRCSAPALCTSCQRFSVHNYLAKRPRCPSCRRPVTFYNDESLRAGDGDGRTAFRWNTMKVGEGAFVLPDTRYKCPACGEMRLRFRQVGRFD